MKRIHFIAIGGAAMHNLAIALKSKGYEITGSDDEIFDPSYTRLKKYEILPEAWGWYPEKLDQSIDAIILGMHARKDNPELRRAQELGLKIYSYPEFLYEQTRDKKRAVIAGSHGKTSITAMILHVLQHAGIKFDYMVGSQIDGFDTMVGLSPDSSIAVFEGDEYLSSPLDLRPKFLHYKPDIALISGIAWDHINVFPTWEGYVEQFGLLVDELSSEGHLVYYTGDPEVVSIAERKESSVSATGYKAHPHENKEGRTVLIREDGSEVALKVFGAHNMQNISGAKEVCKLLGIDDEQFYSAIGSFSGTAKRLQKLKDSEQQKVFLDFAHSPSKVKATVEAVKAQFPDKHVFALFELHTFSSLNKEFLPQYAGVLDKADEAVVFYSPEVVAHKKLEAFSANFVKQCFGGEKLLVITEKEHLERILREKADAQEVLLLMSSGNLGGLDIKDIFHI